MIKEKKKVQVPKSKLCDLVDTSIDPKGITTNIVKVVLEKLGKDKGLEWKLNSRGHFTAWK